MKNKQNYELLYNAMNEPDELNEPFCFMKAEQELYQKLFCLWRLNQDHQAIHTHDYYQIWYILRGECSHNIDNQEIRLKCGDLLCIPPFTYHSMHGGTGDLVVIGIDFTEDFFADTEADAALMLRCVQPLFLRQTQKLPIFWADNDLQNLIQEMYYEFTVKEELFDIVIKSNLTKLLVMIQRMSSNGEKENPQNERAVAEILKYIHLNFYDKITIHDLCKLVNLSESLVSRSFKNITGKTIVAYINELKIEKAKQLLRETDLQITDIAYELGFNDGAYFNRVFKKNAQLTPNEYRSKRCK